MPYPDGVGAIDLMIGFPFRDKKAVYEYLDAGIKDGGSESLEMPAGYMFKDVPAEASDDVDPIDVTFGEMDRWGVAAGLFGVSEQSVEPSPADLWGRLTLELHGILSDGSNH